MNKLQFKKTLYLSMNLASSNGVEPSLCRLGVWHTTLYVIRMRDFQYARNLATTGFCGRSTHYRVLACTTCFLLILYRPISTLLANSLCRPREIFFLFTLVDCDYYTFETTLCQALKRE